MYDETPRLREYPTKLKILDLTNAVDQELCTRIIKQHLELIDIDGDQALVLSIEISSNYLRDDEAKPTAIVHYQVRNVST